MPETIIVLLVSFGLQTIAFIREIIGKPIFSEFADELLVKLEDVATWLKGKGRLPREELVRKVDSELGQTTGKLTAERVLRLLETKGKIREYVSGEQQKMEKFVEWVPARRRLASYVRSLWSR